MIRVHYSISGNNVAILNDLDQNGTPDYVELVAHTANDVLEFYADVGFRFPIAEEAVGLSDLGGTSAFDLGETERSLHKPPSGMTTSFSYGTAIFFAFWDEYYGEEVSRMVSLQESLENIDESNMIDAVIAQMDDVQMDWMTFSQWNLATNIRSGEMSSYSFASQLYGLQSEMEGTILEDDYRFYPLATTYFELEHLGGPCTFVYVGDDEDVRFSLHPVVNGDKVGPSVKEWRIGDEAIWTESFDAGEY